MTSAGTTIKKLVYISTVDMSRPSAQPLQIRQMSSAFFRVYGDAFEARVYDSSYQRGAYDYPHVVFKQKSRKLFRSVWAIRQMLFHLHPSTEVFTRDLFLAKVATVFGRKVIWECHQELSFSKRLWVKLFACFPKFRILTISNALADTMPFAEKKGRVFVYHDCADLSRYERAGTDLFGDHKVAVYTGALHKGKDVDSLAPLFDAFPDWRFLFVGGGGEKLQSYRDRYQSFTNVEFIGRQAPAEIPVYQKSASILLYPLTNTNPFWRYTSPLKLFEYMAAGKPIVASNIGSVAEIFSEKNGFVFGGNTTVVDAFRQCMQASPEELDQLKRRNAELISTTYNWDARAQYIKSAICKQR